MSDPGKLTKDDVRNQRIAVFSGYFAPIRGATTITPSNTDLVTPGRKFAVFCTVAGNVKVGFVGGGTLVFPTGTGFAVYDWAVNQVFVTLTTATAVYTNLS